MDADIGCTPPSQRDDRCNLRIIDAKGPAAPSECPETTIGLHGKRGLIFSRLFTVSRSMTGQASIVAEGGR
jgi:hypothetical protein